MREINRGNIIKRTVSLLLISVMMLSVTSCTNKPTTVKSAVEQLTSFDVNESDIDFKCVTEAEGGNVEFSGKATIVNINKNDCAIEIKYRTDGAEYTTVSTLFITEDGIYINAKQAFAFISKILPQYASLGSYLNLSVDYVKITEKEMESYLKQYAIDSSFATSADTKNSAVVMKKITFGLLDMLWKLSEKTETHFATVEDGVLKMNITSESAATIFKEIEEFDYAQYNSSISVEQKRYYNSQVQNAIEKLADPVGKDIASAISIVGQTEGKKGRKVSNITLNLEMTNDKSERVTVNMNVSNRQVAISSYVVPSEYSSISELTSRISMGGSTTK